MDDAHFDALLREELAPPERPADRSFVLRVERAVAEAERYRRWRAALLRQFASEGLAVASVGVSLALIGRAPPVREALDQASWVLWPALLSLFLFWLLLRGRGGALA